MSVIVREASELAASIIEHIQSDKQNLLLFAGGSFLEIVPDILTAIVQSDQITQKDTQILISIIDERWSESDDDPDSNFNQLMEVVSQVDIKGSTIKFHPVLSEGLSLEDTTASFDKFITESVHGDTNIIGVMGVGKDGHLMGILPHKQEYHRKFSKNYVTGYKTDDVAKQENKYPYRITLNFNGAMKLDFPILYAVGEGKVDILKRLIGMSSPTHKQIAEVPVHFLHTLKNEVELFTDQELFD